MNILIIDPHPIMSDAFAQLLRRVVPSAKVQTCTTLRQLESAQAKAPAHLVIAEPREHESLDMGLMAVLEGNTTPFIIFSTDPVLEHEPPGVAHGHFISKRTAVKDIVAELSRILLPPVSDPAVAAPVKLTKRMRQFLVCLDKGKSNRDIADDFGISEHTVKVHMWRMFKRIGVNSRTSALHYARTNGWL
jgi:DNA-binding NarL/FixJ family response regulator